MMKIIFAILSVATIFISPDCSGSKVKVTESWAVAETVKDLNNPDAPPADVASVYLTIANNGKEVDRLVGVTSTAADVAQIVETAMKDGSPQPVAIPGIDIKPDHEVTLKPRKSFIRLSNLKQPLIEGASFQMTLSFQNAGEIKQSVLVEKKGSLTYDN